MLGVAHDADLEKIKKAYRKLARAHHPDMSKAADAESKFKEAADNDLYFELALTPWEAVLGAEIEMPTLEDSVLLTIPVGTRHGQKLRLKGRGLPASPGVRGDLFAVVHLETPQEISPEEFKLYQQLAVTSKFSPRQVTASEKQHETSVH